MDPFELPDQLPVTFAELEALAAQATAEIRVFQARHAANQELSDEDVDRLEYLVKSRQTLFTARDEAATSEQTHTDRLNGLLNEAADEPAEQESETAAEPEGAEVVAETEQVAADAAAEPETITAAAPVTFAGAAPTVDIPGDEAPPEGERPKRWNPLTSMPKYADFVGQKVSTLDIAESVASVLPGSRSGRMKTGETTRGGRTFESQALARLERPQGGPDLFESPEDLFAELDRIACEIPGHGKVSAQALVAAGGWCAPSEQLYDFCPTPAAANLLSLPELAKPKRGGIRFPAEPDFTSLQVGFHFTEPELEAVDGQGEPTAIKNFVEIPCPDDMVEYRLEAIGWAVKAGILQRDAWPELIAKFMDEFLVAHQHRVSALTLQKMLATAGSAKVVPTDAVLGATTGILNGLHVRARNLQLKSRIDTIEGVAPVWFRDVLKADLANRDGKDVLNVTDAEIDAWLAARGIRLQFEGRWQSLTTGMPGDLDTAWWPGSVDVLLYPAGTFFRALDNVITLGVEYPMDQLQKNRYTQGFVEDSFLVGKRCYPANLIRVPLCVNGAVGAREHIDCSTEYSTKTTKSFSFPGTPTGGGVTFKFSGNPGVSASVAYNDSTGNVDTKLTAIDDGVSQAGDITVAGGPLPGTAVQVTYPAKLGDLQVGTNSLTGGTQPGAGVPIT